MRAIAALIALGLFFGDAHAQTIAGPGVSALSPMELGSNNQISVNQTQLSTNLLASGTMYGPTQTTSAINTAISGLNLPTTYETQATITAAGFLTGSVAASTYLPINNPSLTGFLTSPNPLIFTGAGPVLSGCGGATTAVAGSNSARGSITESGVLTVGCTITFSGTYPSAPFCVVNSSNGASLSSAVTSLTGSTAALVITNVGLTGARFNYLCDW